MCTIYVDKVHIDQVTINYKSGGNEESEENTMIATISVGNLLVSAPSTVDGNITLQSPSCQVTANQLWRVTTNIFPRPSLFLISMESMQYPGYFIGVKGSNLGDALGLSNADIESNGWSTEASIASSFPLQNNDTRFFIGSDGMGMTGNKLIQVTDSNALDLSFNEVN